MYVQYPLTKHPYLDSKLAASGFVQVSLKKNSDHKVYHIEKNKWDILSPLSFEKIFYSNTMKVELDMLDRQLNKKFWNGKRYNY